jgi:hypothetical protein
MKSELSSGTQPEFTMVDPHPTSRRAAAACLK